MSTMAIEDVGAPIHARRWRLRITATIAAVLLGVGLYLVQRLPGAQSLHDEDESYTTKVTQALALYDIPRGQILQFDGKAGAGLRVTANSARLADATRKEMQARRVALPNARGGVLQWIGKPSDQGAVQVMVQNEGANLGPTSGLMIQATGRGHIPSLGLTAIQQPLKVTLTMPAVGDEAGFEADLNIAGAAIDDPQLGFRAFNFLIEPGDTATLTFDSVEALAESTFSVGQQLDDSSDATALPIGRLEVGPRTKVGGLPIIRRVDRGVCAARAGRLLYKSLTPQPDDCRASDHLYATGIDVQPGRIDLQVEGSGFVTEDAVVRPSSVLAAIFGNPVIAAIVGALVLAVVRPLWRLWWGRDM